MSFRTITGAPPLHQLPAGATDCHMHVIDPAHYPLPQEGGPAPALLSDYESVTQWLGIDRVVLVQANGYRMDNSCLLNALQQLGSSARGIVVLDPAATDTEIDALSTQGVCGVRIMNLMNGPLSMNDLLAVNARVSPFGWSLIAQFDGRYILDYRPILERVRGNYVIDHLGKFLTPVRVESREFQALLKLIDRGNCYVKLAAFYETSQIGGPGFDDVAPLARALIAHAPERVIWGTNWPHLMATDAAGYPNDAALLDLAWDWIGSDENRHRVFVDNPARLYNFNI